MALDTIGDCFDKIQFDDQPLVSSHKALKELKSR